MQRAADIYRTANRVRSARYRVDNQEGSLPSTHIVDHLSQIVIIVVPLQDLPPVRTDTNGND